MDYSSAEIAGIYDVVNPWSEDLDFYLSLAPATGTCDVLDLGCGTGTLCSAFARRGHRVTGVDPAAAMLAIARSKPQAEQIEWVESSAQCYRSQRRFDLIVMTGHVFQTFLFDADALAALGSMRDHLKPNGKVAFETRNPPHNWVKEWTTRPPVPRTLRGQQFNERLEIESHKDEFISFRTSYDFPHTTLTTSSTLRFPSREHVEALIAQSGLSVREVFGDWDASPFDFATSREIIFIATLA
ncbi:MAG TPA: class I SAM-dependent methyltransferase [Terriglobales bacterium]|nr:class I SAM-dependent methyltransferase [Terriglobales bacterium]